MLSQTRPADKIIVVDSASSDNTPKIFLDIIKGLPEKTRKRLIFKRLKKNLPPAGTFNVGLGLASSDYIIFLPADDWFHPQILEKQAEILDKHPKIGAVYSQTYTLTHGKKFLRIAKPAGTKTVIGRNEFARLLTQGDFIPLLTLMTKTKILKQLGGWDENLRFRIDHELWIRIAKFHPFAYLAQPLAYYQIHTKNDHLKPSFIGSYEYEFGYILKTHLNHKSSLKNLAYYNHLIQLTHIEITKKNYTRSLILFLKAAKTRPSSILSLNTVAYPYHILKNVTQNFLKKPATSDTNNSSVKLILGCGPLPMNPEHYMWIDDTWIFTDLYPTDKRIIKLDARNINYPNSSIDALYASHLLEHISHLETQKTLQEWHRVLKSRGRLIINVPDLEWACEKFLANYKTNTPIGSPAYKNYQELLLVFYGHQYQPGEFHKTGFTQKSLKRALLSTKFKNVTVEKTFDSHQIGVLIAIASK